MSVHHDIYYYSLHLLSYSDICCYCIHFYNYIYFLILIQHFEVVQLL